jgi:hypothetical protein
MSVPPQQDRPDGPELLIALSRWLAEDLLPVVPREQRFNVRIAANSCAILAREWASAAPGAEREAARAELAELARAIRAGEHDGRWDETFEAVRDLVKAKVDVAHPGYAKEN